MISFLNDSAQTTFEGIQNSVYTNLYGIPHTRTYTEFRGIVQ
jgi:hypothetical protein